MATDYEEEGAMTVTYDITNDVGKVRLLIGDKTIADPVFTDEELQYFITAEGSVNLGAAAALEAWAAQYGANADSEKIGDYAYTQSIVNKMLALAANLRAGAVNVPAMAWAEINVVEDD
jgi:hypothetical protein